MMQGQSYYSWKQIYFQLNNQISYECRNTLHKCLKVNYVTIIEFGEMDHSIDWFRELLIELNINNQVVSPHKLTEQTTLVEDVDKVMQGIHNLYKIDITFPVVFIGFNFIGGVERVNLLKGDDKTLQFLFDELNNGPENDFEIVDDIGSLLSMVKMKKKPKQI